MAFNWNKYHQELMSHWRWWGSMKLVLPAECHRNPNASLNTFHIRKVTLLLEAVYGLCMTAKNNGGGFLVVVYDKAYCWIMLLSKTSLKGCVEALNGHTLEQIYQIWLMFHHLLYKRRKYLNQNFKCCDIIWVGLELSFMLPCCLWWLIGSSWYHTI